MELKGDFNQIYKTQPKLLIISNHASHIDAVSIAAAIPFSYWRDLFIAAAKTIGFKIRFSHFFLNTVWCRSIDRKDRSGEAVKLYNQLLSGLDRIWMILFPEGSRSKDGYIHRFKEVSIFAERNKVPILFLYLDGNSKLMPKEVSQTWSTCYPCGSPYNPRAHRRCRCQLQRPGLKPLILMHTLRYAMENLKSLLAGDDEN